MKWYANRTVTSNQRQSGVDRVVLVHEAGHAVARVLAARSLGWRADEVINQIEVYPAPIAKGPVRVQATFSGKYLSKQMEVYRAAHHQPPVCKALFASMRTARIAVDEWFQAQCFTAIFGPMAEAKAIGRPFSEVWANETSTSDVRDALRDGLLCGMTPKQISDAMQDNASIAEYNIARPEVWRAVLALADTLKPGIVTGPRAAQIILHALTAET